MLQCSLCGEVFDQPAEDFVDKLIAALQHPVPDRAGLAIDVLAYRLREPRAIIPLIDLLRNDTDAAVLKQAVLALGHFQNHRAVEPLVKLLEDEATPLVARHAAVTALAQIGGPHAEAGIRSALVDPSGPVRDLARAKLAELCQHEDTF